VYIFYAISIIHSRLRRRKSICILHLDEISQFTTEIKSLPVSKNGRPPYWNFTYDFDFDLHVAIDIWFWFTLPNVVLNRRSAAELWRYIDFSRWRPWSKKSTSGYRFSDGTCSRRYIPNFSEISLFMAKMKLLPVSKKWTTAILELYFRFRFWPMCSHWQMILL